ncbi:DUF7768 domain-containing protein [Selenomonas sp. FOBRC6]|uniref:DUF7768 domain-containing protein n=1 Tax=Selenomonas sp. FOBRC6 TaxID=936572 RepID=UPI000561C2A9
MATNEKTRHLVYIASAYSGDIDGNTRKARLYCRFAALEGKSPIAPHLYLPSFLSEETERELALEIDLAILNYCSELWAFGEPTVGMKNEMAAAEEQGIRIRRFTENMEEIV